MVVSLSQGLSTALEVVKNLSKVPEISDIQERNYQMALCLLIVARRLFDFNSKKSDLAIIQEWHVNDTEITRLYLAQRQDSKYFLYVCYIGLKNPIGFYIKDEDLQRIINLNEYDLLDCWKELF